MTWISFFGGVALGAMASWLITRHYYLRAAKDQNAALAALSNQLRQKNTLADFEVYLDTSDWTKTHVNGEEVWMANADNTVQIQIGERERDFKESWTTVYPDKNSALYPVYLKIGGTTIRQLNFIYMDGGRIFVPMADRRVSAQGAVEYFWNASSLEVKVCNIIGAYYIYNNLAGVAEVSKVEILK
jgi:hypothetical protein